MNVFSSKLSSDNRKSKIQNRKWLGLSVIVFVLVFFGAVASAQQPKKISRIGYLAGTNPATESTRTEAIRLALRELGYTEGQNITIEYRYGQGKVAPLPELVADLVRLKVDIIIAAGGTNVVRAVKNATKTIPIVMAGEGIDPVEARIVESLARPGGNITGLTNLVTDLGGKRLELLKEVVPKIFHVAVLYDPVAAPAVREVNEILPATAHALGFTVQPWEVRSTDDFDKIFGALSKERPDGLYVPGGALMFANRKRIVDFALKSRLTSMYFRRQFVDAGGLMSYGADEANSYQRVAYYVDKILKGAKPANLPVEQPTKFELVINLKTAKQIGLAIPPNVLARADKVIR
jgi:putative ABC transport system substrate-binding protein